MGGARGICWMGSAARHGSYNTPRMRRVRRRAVLCLDCRVSGVGYSACVSCRGLCNMNGDCCCRSLLLQVARGGARVRGEGEGRGEVRRSLLVYVAVCSPVVARGGSSGVGGEKEGDGERARLGCVRGLLGSVCESLE